MLSKDHLRNVYIAVSLNNNNLVMENITCIWVHRFGVDSLNELKFQNQVISNNKELSITVRKENDQSEKNNLGD